MVLAKRMHLLQDIQWAKRRDHRRALSQHQCSILPTQGIAPNQEAQCEADFW
jgi:hypothetical protein